MNDTRRPRRRKNDDDNNDEEQSVDKDDDDDGGVGVSGKQKARVAAATLAARVERREAAERHMREQLALRQNRIRNEQQQPAPAPSSSSSSASTTASSSVAAVQPQQQQQQQQQRQWGTLFVWFLITVVMALLVRRLAVETVLERRDALILG
jgi:hypothetical protein